MVKDFWYNDQEVPNFFPGYKTGFTALLLADQPQNTDDNQVDRDNVAK
jgi:hypothetical protein